LEVADLGVSEAVRIWPSRELAKALLSARPGVPLEFARRRARRGMQASPEFREVTPSAEAEPAPPANSVVAILKKASPEDLQSRTSAMPCSRTRTSPESGVSRREACGGGGAKYRQAELQHGSGFVGLLPDYSRQGNPQRTPWPRRFMPWRMRSSTKSI
jgi:hypothetical protein